MTRRVMVDIETLGLDPGAAILSIGAVEFDTDALGAEFYEEVSLQSCQDAGLSIDAETLEWWLGLDESVNGVLRGGSQLEGVLKSFSLWFPDDAEIWANAPSFDCTHLEAAYEAVGLSEPWEYYDQRDVRTVRNLPCAVEVEQDGDEHHALHDARWQAREVGQTLAKLEERDLE